jgi:predicted amidohydrolase YtcJ
VKRSLAIAAATLLCVALARAEAPKSVGLVVRNARIVTNDPARPRATALIVTGGGIEWVGDDAQLDGLRFRGERTQIDGGGRTLIPGLVDSHLHVTRGGRYYNLELRWDGVRSLARALAMVREQAQRTPKGQWVRVVGGWSPYQFEEKRMPTVAELNAAAPDTPAFVLFLYSQARLNRAAVQALGITQATAPPDGGRIELLDGGAIFHADPNPLILYQLVAKPPPLSAADQVNSTLHFYRELNRLGVTSAVDAGGGGHAFPDDYAGSEVLARDGKLPLRISYYLFPQVPGREAVDFARWSAEYQTGRNDDPGLAHGFELEGGGETLAHSAVDWENFLSPRPDLDARKDAKRDLHQVVTILVKQQWPLRAHATYGESIARILDVFEQVKREQGRFAPRFAIDHAETVREPELQRIRALGGGIAIQSRMAFAGEYFAERYGRDAARHAPPLRKMLALGIPVGAGTDGTRVSSYDPWPALYWLVSGRTVGGTKLFADDNRLSREEALRLYTEGSAWFSQEEDVKGRIAPGRAADFALLTEDYLAVPEERIRTLESVLTVVNGEVVYAAAPFEAHAPPPLPPPSPAWSPVAHFGAGRDRK